METTGKNYEWFDAVMNDDVITVMELAKQFDVDCVDEHGHTALMLAAYHKKVNVLNVLLASGVDVNNRDNKGFTAICMICKDYETYKDAISLLLDSGADVNIPNGIGFTPLMYAVKQKSLILMVKLIYHGADIDLTTKSGHTALDVNAYGNSNGCEPLTKLFTDNIVQEAILRTNPDNLRSLNQKVGLNDYIKDKYDGLWQVYMESIEIGI